MARLQALAGSPATQREYAVDLLAHERGIRVVSAALAVVGAAPGPAAGPVLRPLFDDFMAAGVRRDPGGRLRVDILAALQRLADPADQALAERAVATYEFMPPGRVENAGALRAAGLALLQDLDPPQAAYQAVRLLTDPHTSTMSGEPAVSAARLLADQGQRLPLYAYLVDPRGGLAEVVAACFAGLAGLPRPILDGLVAQYGAAADDLVLAALFDLLLTHPAPETYRDFVTTFLGASRRLNVYRYLVSALVADRRPAWETVLLEAARAEQDPRKVAILLPALALLPPSPALATLVTDLERRL